MTADRVTLTRREAVVLTELVRGNGARDIAERLHVSPNTVKSQLRSLYRKLGAQSRAEALAIATELGLIDPPV